MTHLSKLAITFDAYNTLFDFITDAERALRAILPPEGRQHLRDVLETMNAAVPRLLDQFLGRRRSDFSEFLTLAAIHRAGFDEVKAHILPALDVDAATDAWNRYIAQVPLYPDARAAVEWVAARFPIAIVSDIDTWMLEDNVRRTGLPIRHVVTSEREGTYKAMADSTMFQVAARLLGCAPRDIVHVGDSSADIIGARRAGARAIWLNRPGIQRPMTMPAPDGEIYTLAELPNVLAPIARERGIPMG